MLLADYEYKVSALKLQSVDSQVSYKIKTGGIRSRSKGILTDLTIYLKNITQNSHISI